MVVRQTQLIDSVKLEINPDVMTTTADSNNSGWRCYNPFGGVRCDGADGSYDSDGGARVGTSY